MSHTIAPPHFERETLVKVANGRIESARKQLASFGRQFEEDPLSALKRAEFAYDAAADLSIWTDLRDSLEQLGGCTSLPSLSDRATRTALRLANDRVSDTVLTMLTDSLRRSWAIVAAELKAVERHQKTLY